MEMPNAGVKLEKLDVPCIVRGTVKCHSRSGKHLEISLETERALATRPSSLPCVRVPQRERSGALHATGEAPSQMCVWQVFPPVWEVRPAVHPTCECLRQL